MAIGLTDHVWSYREYLWLPVHADPFLRQQMDEQISQLLTPAVSDAAEQKVSAKAPPTKAKKKRAQPLKKAA